MSFFETQCIHDLQLLNDSQLLSADSTAAIVMEHLKNSNFVEQKFLFAYATMHAAHWVSVQIKSIKNVESTIEREVEEM